MGRVEVRLAGALRLVAGRALQFPLQFLNLGPQIGLYAVLEIHRGGQKIAAMAVEVPQHRGAVVGDIANNRPADEAVGPVEEGQPLLHPLAAGDTSGDIRDHELPGGTIGRGTAIAMGAGGRHLAAAVVWSLPGTFDGAVSIE